MSNEQKSKILDVMHTLSCIHAGQAINPKSSAKACHTVLQKVIELEGEATHE